MSYMRVLSLQTFIVSLHFRLTNEENAEGHKSIEIHKKYRKFRV